MLLGKKISRYAMTLAKTLRREAEGRGTGEGSGYKSWLTVYDGALAGWACIAERLTGTRRRPGAEGLG